MKNTVMIKSFPNGIALSLDPDVSWEEILQETGEKFEQGRSFFKNAQVAVTFEGRVLSEQQESELYDVITRSSDLQVFCICHKDGTSAANRLFVHALDRAGNILREHEQEWGGLAPGTPLCQLHSGNVSDGMVLESKESLLILGDVAPGCAVVSEKSIFVLGALRGEAVAGTPGGYGHLVFALDLSPEKLIVDGVRGRAAEKKRWNPLGKPAPRAALIREHSVALVPVAKDAWTELLT